MERQSEKSKAKAPKFSPLEKRLGKKAEQGIKELRRVRENKLEDIFTKRYYISPEDLLIGDYLRSKPLAAFNPGALEKDGKLLIFPRLIFDYYLYHSSIGVFSLPIEEVIAGKIDKPIRCKILLWPQEPWEFGLGCQDPRACLVDKDIFILYDAFSRKEKKRLLALAEYNSELALKRKGRFWVVKGNKKFAISNCDTAFITVENDKATLLTRPTFPGLEPVCWRAEADLKTLIIGEGSLKPVFTYEKWEEKVGWSTNAVKLSPNKHLVGWHGVMKEDCSYKNGLAVVDDNGEVLGVSNYLLAPKGIKENYGDRPWVIFGDGLVRHGKYLIWIGGMSDYAIGIFITELEKALDKIKWVK